MSKPTYAALMEQRDNLREEVEDLRKQLEAATSDAFSEDDPRRPFVEQVVIAAVLSKGVGILSHINIAGTKHPPQVVSHIREAVDAVELGLEMLDGKRPEVPGDPEAEAMPDPKDDDSSDVTDFSEESMAAALNTGADL